MLNVTNSYRGKQNRNNLLHLLNIDTVFTANTDEYIRFIFRISKYEFFKIDYMLNSDAINVSFVMKNIKEDYIEMSCNFEDYQSFTDVFKKMNASLSRQKSKITIQSMSIFFSLTSAEKDGQIVFAKSEEILSIVDEKIINSPTLNSKKIERLNDRRKRLLAEIKGIDKEISELVKLPDNSKEIFSMPLKEYNVLLDESRHWKRRIKESFYDREIFVKQVRGIV